MCANYSDKEPATDAERTAVLREQCRLNDLCDLRGPEFLRLLNLAHSEGLLDELIRHSASQFLQVAPRQNESEALSRLEAPETQSNNWPFADRDHQQDAYRPRSEEFSFQSTALASDPPLETISVLNIIAVVVGSENIATQVIRSLAAENFFCVPGEATEKMLSDAWGEIHDEDGPAAWRMMVRSGASTAARETLVR
jgi:hypothetical protein